MNKLFYWFIGFLFICFFMLFADKIWDRNDLISYSDKFSDKICSELNDSLSTIAHYIDGLAFGLKKDIGGKYSVKLETSNKYIDDFKVIDDSTNDFYFDVIKKAGEIKKGWYGPHLDSIRQKQYFFYFTPLVTSDKIKRGIVYSLSTSNVYRYLQYFGVDRIGYGYLINKDAVFVAHPQNETRNYEQFANEINERTLIKLVRDFKNGESKNMKEYHHVNTVTQKTCWEILKQIGDLDLYLGISVNDNHVYDNPVFRNMKRRQIVNHSLILVFLVLIAGFCLINKIIAIQSKINSFALFFTIIILIEIFLIVRTSINYPVINFGSNSKNELLTRRMQILRNNSDSDDLKEFLGRWNFSMIINQENQTQNLSNFIHKQKLQNKTSVVKIPTGVYLQTIKFKDSHSTDITGIVWQKYPQEWSEQKGIVFPEAEQCRMELLDSISVVEFTDSLYLYRWSFEITIREPFNFKHYPLDRNDLWLRMQHVDYSEKYILVPDLMSYSVMSPSFLPGIDPNVDMPGWILEGSFFSYKDKSYCTSFGNTEVEYKTEFPELHFNLMLHRDYNDPFVCKVIPLLVLLFMMYSILFIGGEKARLEVVIGCSGLFFVAIFEHIDLRQSLSATGIIYLESDLS